MFHVVWPKKVLTQVAGEKIKTGKTDYRVFVVSSPLREQCVKTDTSNFRLEIDLTQMYRMHAHQKLRFIDFNVRIKCANEVYSSRWWEARRTCKLDKYSLYLFLTDIYSCFVQALLHVPGHSHSILNSLRFTRASTSSWVRRVFLCLVQNNFKYTS